MVTTFDEIYQIYVRDGNSRSVQGHSALYLVEEGLCVQGHSALYLVGLCALRAQSPSWHSAFNLVEGALRAARAKPLFARW